jgi:hypothetical protein
VGVAGDEEHPDVDVATEASILEIYRERKEYDLLAIHFDSIGNTALRDKYVDLAVRRHPGDVAFLRGELQKRPDLIPQAAAERALQQHERDGAWNLRARLLAALGRPLEAVRDHVRGIAQSIEEGNAFGAAFYLKEVTELGFVDALFREAARQASEKGDLWWQIRALQELGADEELKALVLANAKLIEKSGERSLQMHLAKARGDDALYGKLRIEDALSTRWTPEGIQIVDQELPEGVSLTPGNGEAVPVRIKKTFWDGVPDTKRVATKGRRSGRRRRAKR